MANTKTRAPKGKDRTPRGPAAGKERADKLVMMRRVQRIQRWAAGINPPTRAELAAEFKITPRAVNNIITFMRELGVDIITAPRVLDSKLAYVVRASDFLKLDMTVAEAVASVHLQQAVLDLPLAGDGRAAAEGVSRIAANLGDHVRGKLKALDGRFAVRMLRAAKPPRNEAFRVVIEAILENRVLEIDYESPYKPRAGNASGASSASSARGTGTDADPDLTPGLGKARRIESIAIEPYGIFFARRSWYVVANKRPGQGMRLYKLARFKRVTVGDATFTMPRNWTIEGYLKNAWEIMVDQKAAPTRVVIDFDAKVAGNMVETMWHPTQSVDPLPGGGVRFTVNIAGLDEIQPWVLGFGRHARVVAPKELRERIRAEVRAMHDALGPEGSA